MLKKGRLLTFLSAAVLSFLLGMSSIGCLVSAFSIRLADLWLLGLICAATAVVCALCYTGKLALIPICVVALSAGYLWQSGILSNGLESLVYRLTRVYNAGYGWPILHWSYRTADDMELTLAPFLYVLGGGLTMLTAWVVARGHSSLLALLPGCLPVMSCFVVTDTLPDLVWLLLFFTTLLIMLLSSSIRQDDTAHGAYLAAMVAIPALLCVTLLFYCIPESGYHRQPMAQAISNALFSETPVQEAWEEITGQSTVVGSSVDGSTVDLSRVGYRQNSRSEVMRLNSRYSGTLYLRGRALDGYSGIEWYDTKDSIPLSWPEESKLESIGEVVITTRYAHRMLYLPYYVTSVDMDPVARGMENSKKLSMYSFACSIPDAASFSQLYPDATTSAAPYAGDLAYSSFCTRLPQETESWAKPLAAQLTEGIESPYHKAQAIARYVRQSARYDLETRRMSTRSGDFARWFLEDSETGYCVHFASATTVLLKAAGIPARYVTGYMVQVENSSTTVVRAKDAHAWTEYWLPGFGWTILESTPAALPETEASATQEATTPSQAPEQTQPAATRPAVTQPQNKPQGTNTPVTPSGKTRALPILLLAAAAILLILGATVIQWRLRVLLRRKKRHRGDPNQQALAHWQEALRLHRRTRTPPSRQLHLLAEKARFSQHTLEAEELAVFDLHLDSLRQQLRSRNIFLRFWYTVILALY